MPGAIGVYTGGGNYNPAQVLRTNEGAKHVAKIDKMLAAVPDKSYVEIPWDDMQALIRWTVPDDQESEHVWDPVAVAESLKQWHKSEGRPKVTFT